MSSIPLPGKPLRLVYPFLGEAVFLATQEKLFLWLPREELLPVVEVDVSDLSSEQLLSVLVDMVTFHVYLEFETEEIELDENLSFLSRSPRQRSNPTHADNGFVFRRDGDKLSLCKGGKSLFELPYPTMDVFSLNHGDERRHYGFESYPTEDKLVEIDPQERKVKPLLCMAKEGRWVHVDDAQEKARIVTATRTVNFDPQNKGSAFNFSSNAGEAIEEQEEVERTFQLNDERQLKIVEDESGWKVEYN